MSQEILAIVGPTASGKTDLGLRLAREQNGEIISVDSRQVYRHLSVGTAKPQGRWNGDRYEVDGIPYPVDFWDPLNRFSASVFVKEATARLADIRGRGKTPIFVGGTGLYYKALVEGLAPVPPANESVRAELQTIAEKKGRPYLHKELSHVDPESAARIPANNIHRVIRALEVHQLTGKPMSVWHQEHQTALERNGHSFPLKYVGIELKREELQKRIEERSRKMIAAGLIAETRDLLNKGYPENCPALTGLGYPRVIAFLKGQLSKEDLLKYLIQDTRQYAKRQMTWFKHQLKVE
jgi:tRNA dimethylallyltransferase